MENQTPSICNIANCPLPYGITGSANEIPLDTENFVYNPRRWLDKISGTRQYDIVYMYTVYMIFIIYTSH